MSFDIATQFDESQRVLSPATAEIYFDEANEDDLESVIAQQARKKKLSARLCSCLNPKPKRSYASKQFERTKGQQYRTNDEDGELSSPKRPSTAALVRSSTGSDASSSSSSEADAESEEE